MGSKLHFIRADGKAACTNRRGNIGTRDKSQVECLRCKALIAKWAAKLVKPRSFKPGDEVAVGGADLGVGGEMSSDNDWHGYEGVVTETMHDGTSCFVEGPDGGRWFSATDLYKI